MKRIFTANCIVLALLLSCSSPVSNNDAAEAGAAYKYSGRKKILADHGAVVSAHPLASKAGIDILKAGGNAMDAVITTQLALAVVYPGAGNLGGGGFLVGHLKDGKNIAIDFRETAPGHATRDMYIDSSGTARTDLSQQGHLSAGIPGTVRGLFATLPYARLPFEKLIQPAIELAEKGFAITAQEAASLNELQNEFIKYNTVRPVFVKDTAWKEGDTLIQTDLAHTLKRIKEKGAAGFYEGETAQLIVDEMKRGKGIITLDDLKNYKAVTREPHTFNYKGYQVISMPMPSSGGLLLHQMMKMVEKRGIDKMGFHTTASVQLMIEAERRAFADRATYMGDPDFYKVPVKALINDKYLDERMKDYNPAKAGVSSQVHPGNVIPYESEETTHLDVLDSEGNAVSVTTTLNNSYGSHTVVGGAGFFLNDEMDDFSIKPGVANMYGATGGEANAIMPGKRMLSSMTPTIVLKDNQPFIIVGTPGGTTIPTSVFQTLINIIDFGLSTEDAVYQPKFHHQWLPDIVETENDFPSTVADSLRQMGYRVEPREEIGRTEVIKVIAGNKLEAIADKRGDDDAEGW